MKRTVPAIIAFILCGLITQAWADDWIERKMNSSMPKPARGGFKSARDIVVNQVGAARDKAKEVSNHTYKEGVLPDDIKVKVDTATQTGNSFSDRLEAIKYLNDNVIADPSVSVDIKIEVAKALTGIIKSDSDNSLLRNAAAVAVLGLSNSPNVMGEPELANVVLESANYVSGKADTFLPEVVGQAGGIKAINSNIVSLVIRTQQPDGTYGFAQVYATVAGNGNYLIVPKHFVGAFSNGDNGFGVATLQNFVGDIYNNQENLPSVKDLVVATYSYPGNVDLAIVELKNPVRGSSPVVLADSAQEGGSVFTVERSGGTPISLKPGFNVISDITWMGTQKTFFSETDSVISVSGSFLTGGDCGVPLYNANRELVGINFGGVGDNIIFGPQTKFINLTQSNIRSWIDGIINPASASNP